MIKTQPEILSITNKEGLQPLHVCCRFCPNRVDVIDLVAKSYPPACLYHIKSGYIVNKESNNKHDNGERHPKHFIADTSVRTHNSNLDLKFHDFDAQVRDGSYPLHIALINGASNEVIHTLVEVGSEVLEMRNKFGKTPLDVAKELNHDETTLSLLQTI
mmetsp:Transcript_3842/g.5033  ORF Transcript_3842/g.5033 Transcript_3842/m.5033 type:complete len:159 (+) Transcript_3842:287-763(+)